MTQGGKQGSMMTAYIMSAVIVIIVAVMLVAIMKQAMVKAFLNMDRDPEFQARMISLVQSRMLFMPEGTEYYYHMPAGPCFINITHSLVYVTVDGKSAWQQLAFTECNLTVPVNISCGDEPSVYIFEKVNGSIAIYHEGDSAPEVEAVCK